jgi:lysophospholipase L1-like esterase
MKENGTSTDDLFELVKDHADWQSTDGVHFNAAGNVALAKQVAESVWDSLRLQALNWCHMMNWETVSPSF